MNVKISNLKVNALNEMNNIFYDVKVIQEHPDSKYAVVEIYKNELYVAVNIIGFEDGLLIANYVDKYEELNCEAMLTKFTVDWECIKYGFCKLRKWVPEKNLQEKTVKRFYFDHELYKNVNGECHAQKKVQGSEI